MIASRLDWTALALSQLICHSLLAQDEGKDPGENLRSWRQEARLGRPSYAAATPCSWLSEEAEGCQGDTKRPWTAGALFPEKEFNFLKVTRLVGCYLPCTDSTKPVLRIWQCNTMVFGLISHFFLSLPLSGINVCAVFMLYDNHVTTN